MSLVRTNNTSRKGELKCPPLPEWSSFWLIQSSQCQSFELQKNREKKGKEKKKRIGYAWSTPSSKVCKKLTTGGMQIQEWSFWVYSMIIQTCSLFPKLAVYHLEGKDFCVWLSPHTHTPFSSALGDRKSHLALSLNQETHPQPIPLPVLYTWNCFKNGQFGDHPDADGDTLLWFYYEDDAYIIWNLGQGRIGGSEFLPHCTLPRR